MTLLEIRTKYDWYNFGISCESLSDYAFIELREAYTDYNYIETILKSNLKEIKPFVNAYISGIASVSSPAGYGFRIYIYEVKK